MKKLNGWLTKIGAALAALVGALVLLAAQTSGGFRWDGPLGRVITPNGDGRNDTAIFCFDNFADSDVSGKIYTLMGSEVASLTRVRSQLAGCPAGNLPQHMIWDPRSSGTRTGVYVYRLTAEGVAFTGTLVVVR